MANRLNIGTLTAALILSIIADSTASANGGKVELVCRYAIDYPSTDDVAAIIPIELEIDSASSSASWNATISGIPVEITRTEFSFSYGEFEYSISRLSGEIHIVSPQGLENANMYRREMTQGLMRQGKSVQDARTEVEAGLQHQLSAHEHRGTCDRRSGYISH
ncbi:MAG: hypothetical protein ACR2QS_04570 [Woeseiaceae bacterium]